MERCNRHDVEWDEDIYKICPMCYFDKTVKFSIDSLRRCPKHNRPTFYKDTEGCAACELADSKQPEKKVGSEVDELQGRIDEIQMVRAERQLEKDGDHGRDLKGGGGLRWL